ncbi:MAG TPA: hypothetical protein VK826_11090, partial [Bacteroidia bacterium]|nr:hypothetical protein [Bacteroidia bacterium]
MSDFSFNYFSSLEPINENIITETSLFELVFGTRSAYSQYNWELFFHIPMLVATRLCQNQRHEEAQKWFHYVFNPNTTREGEVPARFWNFKPFAEYTGLTSIRELTESTEGSLDYQEFEAEVKKWEKNPFNPHLIARARPVAYMRWVVMKYIDNLLEWGDMLFRQDTMESLNEATQLYMLAWNILGSRQEELPGLAHPDKSFSDIQEELDPLSNTDVQVLEERIASSYTEARTRENIIVQQNSTVPATQYTVNNNFGQEPITPELETSVQAELYILKTKYFCTPPNDKLAGYWNFLGDRFFKLRNCRNIEGEFRMLPLYEPPIDPALLIRAQQAGITIADALASASDNTRPHYRFVYLLQRAIDFANDLRTIGSSLLSAIEKKDNEELSLLRSRHEQAMHNTVLENRRLLIQESKELQSALEYSLSIAQRREEFYRSRQFMNSSENMQFILTALTSRMQFMSQGLHQVSALEKAALDFYAGYAGMGGLAVTSGGGSKLGDASDSVAESFSKMASIFNISASEIGQMASYGRRYEEWTHQSEQAGDEITQIEKQILAAQIRIALAEHEFRNQELQIEQAVEQYELMTAKFSGKELHQWMITQFKAIYYQAYQAAVKMAQKAEAALKYELPPLTPQTYIRYGYWDSMKAGLMSGEKLHHDLKQMEVAYITNNKRLHEITKTVSLAMVSAQELVNLKNNGSCGFHVPETLFNLDFPQHTGKLRRIKAVSLSVPCVTGPYTGVNCILTATSEGMSSSIATSTGLNDTGIFQFNFSDERYLPFEGMPVDCDWTIDMNSGLHAFDFGSISDVLLHIHYTADPDLNTSAVITAGGESGPDSGSLPLTRYISLRNEFADEWIRFKNNPQPNLEIPVTEKLFPYMFRQEAMDAIGLVT